MKMLKRIQASKAVVVVVAVLFVAFVTLADHATGGKVILPVFYLLPALWVAWRVGMAEAIAIVVLGAAGLLSGDLLHGRFAHATTPYWNAAARIAGDVVAVYIVNLLRRTNDRLRVSEALRQDLTNMLVHDLKNPLVSASMALQIYQRRHQAGADIGAQGEQDQEELLRIVAESNERLRRLIEEILVVAQAEAREMPLSLEEVDLAEVVREAIREAVTRAERGERKLVASYPPEPLSVTMDAAKIRRVVGNLLDNAAKYSSSPGHIRVQVAGQDAQALVSVHDDGQGIAPEMHQRIFDKFGQAEAVREGRWMSVGLGLAFAKLAVEAHGGRIWVESSPGQGTTFTFALPLTNQGAS
jgi:signal transduction histidine kinase